VHHGQELETGDDGGHGLSDNAAVIGRLEKINLASKRFDDREPIRTDRRYQGCRRVVSP
jgi:hypothetical protein